MKANKASININVTKTLSRPELEMLITRLDRRIKKLREFDTSTITDGHDANIRALRNELIQLLSEIYGHNTPEYNRHSQLAELYIVDLAIGRHSSTESIRGKIQKRIDDAIIQLESIKNGFIEEVEDDSANGSMQRAIKAYQGLELHPRIAEAASGRYRDTHYADAIEASVKMLNELVRLKSGINDLDGMPLMTRAFGGDNPLVKFNTLSDTSNKDEQKGFMFLFNGAVAGLRNPRAHKLIEDDAQMALKFIAFISLLAELLEKAQK